MSMISVNQFQISCWSAMPVFISSTYLLAYFSHLCLPCSFYPLDVITLIYGKKLKLKLAQRAAQIMLEANDHSKHKYRGHQHPVQNTKQILLLCHTGTDKYRATICSFNTNTDTFNLLRQLIKGCLLLLHLLFVICTGIVLGQNYLKLPLENNVALILRLSPNLSKSAQRRW